MSARAGDGAAADLRVWWMTTGEAGSRQQARGLARELSPHAEERVIRVSRLLALAPADLFTRTLIGVRAVEGALGPPWPDILVTCGRRSGLAAMAIRRQNDAPMVLVHIQKPRRPEAFDLVVAMAHDRLTGPNVVQTQAALHGIRAAALAEAAVAGDPRFVGMPRPWTGVLLGGPAGRSDFTPADAARLADSLEAVRARQGGSLLITPSRRTPAATVAMLGARFGADPTCFLWEGAGPNPYLPILACADTLVVTSDSISMISEALATRAQLQVFEVTGGARHVHFLQGLLRRGLVSRLGETAPPKHEPIDATPAIAAIARDLIAAKLGPRN
jgi:hypothetical protein